MPQNAIIRSPTHALAGTDEDYTSLSGWESTEQNANYGSITVGRVDGFFDQGSGALVISGTWTNGARLEPFDSADAFDGTSRKLCGLESTGGTRTLLYNMSTPLEIVGLELYKSGGGGSTKCLDRNSGSTPSSILLDGLLIHAVGRRLTSDVDGLTNSVLVYEGGGTGFIEAGSANSYTNCTVLIDNNGQDVGSVGTSTLTNCVVYNKGTGADFDVGAIQTNCASSDATGNTLTNIVIADNFESSDPITDGDYRIKSGSSLDTNGIGTFVSAGGGGLTVTLGLTDAETDVFSLAVSLELVVEYGLVLSETEVYNLTVLLAKLLTLTETQGETDVFDFDLSQPKEVTLSITEAETQVFYLVVLDGTASVSDVIQPVVQDVIQDVVIKVIGVRHETIS